jgi:type IX secretion system PorP/SprF family membrane protein
MRYLIFLLALISALSLQAQPLAQHNLYPFNPNFANPAATGITNCLEIMATDMHQWVGISNAPGIQSFSIQKGMGSSNYKKHAAGLNLVRDINGPSKSFGGEILYAFHSMINKNKSTWLSLGLSLNLEQRRLDERDFTPVFDPEIGGGVEQELAYNASAGIYLYNEKFFAGISLYNLLPVNNTLSMGYGGDRFFTSLQAGYNFFPAKKNYHMQTSVQASIASSTSQVDLNYRLIYVNGLWSGITLRKYLNQYKAAGQNVILYIGYDWSRWRLAYNYNFDINKTQFHHYGTHQFCLGYRICLDLNSCPAYR